jgi:hypothetical protein
MYDGFELGQNNECVGCIWKLWDLEGGKSFENLMHFFLGVKILDARLLYGITKCFVNERSTLNCNVSTHNTRQ